MSGPSKQHYTDDIGTYYMRGANKMYITPCNDRVLFMRELKLLSMIVRLPIVKAEYMASGDEDLVYLVEARWQYRDKILSRWKAEREGNILREFNEMMERLG